MEKNSDALIKNMKIEIEEKNEQIVWLNEENVELLKRNHALRRQIDRFLFCLPNAKKFLINRRTLPAELLSELFTSLPMENAFDILAKMPNGLLARNMRKMLKGIEMAMRNNKWNEAQCGPKMEISGGGLVVKHSGPNAPNSVRAQLAIPKFNLNANKSRIAYFEVEIMAISYSYGIRIGFCTQKFPLEDNYVGNEQNSIGIGCKGGICIDGKYNSFGNDGGNLQVRDVIGIGIIHFPSNSTMKCFASCNGHFLEMVDLPMKFVDLQIFPAISMFWANNSIRANFCSEHWRYDPREILQNL